MDKKIDQVTAELRSYLPDVKQKSVVVLLHDVENPAPYMQLLNDASQTILFTNSSSTYKQIDNEKLPKTNNVILNCAEFKNCELQPNSADVGVMIKSFNLLSVKEKESVLSKLLTVLSDDAYCFVYEKEWIKDNENHSSTPIDLINYFHSSTSKHSDNKTNYGFALVSVRPLQTYVQLKSEPFHLCFLFKKVHYIDAPETLRDFLDQQQYSKNSVLRYEKIFGPGFVSTGGLDTTKEFVATLDLKPEHRVLDIGAGIGGGDIFIAKTYGCSVIGVDLSTNMVGIAWERLLGLTDAKIKVSFEIGDVMKLEYDNNSFDVVYSRDCILHIQDKHELFTRIYNWLKPGGKLFITDYCCGKKPWSKDYEAYVNDRRYNLLTVQEYGKYLEDVGFKQVEPVDGTNRFADCLKVELERINSMKNEFISEFSDEDYKHLVDGWESKLARTSEGHQRWGIFRATK